MCWPIIWAIAKLPLDRFLRILVRHTWHEVGRLYIFILRLSFSISVAPSSRWLICPIVDSLLRSFVSAAVMLRVFAPLSHLYFLVLRHRHSNFTSFPCPVSGDSVLFSIGVVAKVSPPVELRTSVLILKCERLSERLNFLTKRRNHYD